MIGDFNRNNSRRGWLHVVTTAEELADSWTPGC